MCGLCMDKKGMPQTLKPSSNHSFSHLNPIPPRTDCASDESDESRAVSAMSCCCCCWCCSALRCGDETGASCGCCGGGWWRCGGSRPRRCDMSRAPNVMPEPSARAAICLCCARDRIELKW